MDDVEIIVFAICLTIAALAWLRWYVFVFSVQGNLVPVGPGRGLMGVAPLGATAVLLLVLLTLSSSDVKDSLVYVTFYLLMGIAWLGIAILFMPFAGLSARDDALERRNPGAAFAVSGALIGLMLCFAGGNIGNGPGWWVVVYSAGLATVGLFILWIGLQVLTQISDSVTIGRDAAAGLRLGGFLIAAGLVLGRAVAGDWYGYGETIVDFVRFGWPVLVIAIVAALAELLLRPTVQRPFGPVLTFGLLPASFYVGLALLIVSLEPLSLVMPR